MKFSLLKWIIPTAVLAVVWLGQVETASANVGCYMYSAEVGMVCSTAEQPLPIFATPTRPRNSVLNTLRYARQANSSNVYSEPNGTIVRNVGVGYLFASLQTYMQVDGVGWYQINPGEWMKAAELTAATPTTFQGVKLLRQPPRPFGWVVTRGNPVVPSREPAGPEDPSLGRMNRYDFFEIYDAVVDDEGWLWYDLGDGRWLRQTEVSIIDVKERPADVGQNEFWVEVDLYEQTLAAYEGDRMVFATLISSGLNRWPTREGLFQVFDRWVRNKMSGAEGQVDYYFIEDINHIMYFDELTGIGLHGAFWHDRFGFKHSHGCVNMAPDDAEWVFNWSAQADHDLWVWVHTSDPMHYFDRH